MALSNPMHNKVIDNLDALQCTRNVVFIAMDTQNPQMIKLIISGDEVTTFSPRFTVVKRTPPTPPSSLHLSPTNFL